MRTKHMASTMLTRARWLLLAACHNGRMGLQRPLTSSVERADRRLYSAPPTARAGSSLTFEEYRKLRKSLKMRGRLSGLPVAFIGMSASSAIHIHLNPRMFEMTPEEVQPILGMDPIVFAALCGAGSGIVGFALGGAIFSAVWRTLWREQAQQVAEWDKNFLSRLQKHRFSTVNKYEDDYYGEKVLTLSDYRQWVRQQHRKREKFIASQERGPDGDGKEGGGGEGPPKS